MLRPAVLSTLLAAALSCVLLVPSPAQDLTELETKRAASALEHERVQRALTLTRERMEQISDEIGGIRKDHASLSAALVQAAKTERKLSQEVADIAARIDGLNRRESGLRASLVERRDVLAEVLGALQRMGLNPPPAILVRPEDALSSVRSSILLASVVPELRGETMVLLGDLQELARVVASIEAERRTLLATVEEQAAEQQRLSLLLDEKRQLQARSEDRLAAELDRSAELAAEASSLRELIDALEGDIEIAVRKAEEEARLASLDQESAASPPSELSRTPLLSASAPFSALEGQVAYPVSGSIERRFGDEDDSGGTLFGDMLATHSSAIVTAPVDGSILYAGPFRSYGQLLILNAGEGYHIVLAGIDRISVSPGQTVLAGEPVGLMGEARTASAVAFGDESASPELYVEFRKDGKPVDPAPWWAESLSGRTGNDT
jgi:septal ring factor EnvC (AmiA/AmiB activator)